MVKKQENPNVVPKILKFIKNDLQRKYKELLEKFGHSSKKGKATKVKSEKLEDKNLKKRAKPSEEKKIENKKEEPKKGKSILDRIKPR